MEDNSTQWLLPCYWLSCKEWRPQALSAQSPFPLITGIQSKALQWGRIQWSYWNLNKISVPLSPLIVNAEFPQYKYNTLINCWLCQTNHHESLNLISYLGTHRSRIVQFFLRRYPFLSPSPGRLNPTTSRKLLSHFPQLTVSSPRSITSPCLPVRPSAGFLLPHFGLSLLSILSPKWKSQAWQHVYRQNL